ncbi:unnamed protein product [Owenia fusiformis]|uniref:Leucine-rich PPR motif-containing protein, mitochondrial n=1 Tax=Owenia fusiformis TaxID=6347 RepID=A0A8S4PGW5_OWEFU|nr:unnamed protein product [Owenia fusiformis]
MAALFKFTRTPVFVKYLHNYKYIHANTVKSARQIKLKQNDSRITTSFSKRYCSSNLDTAPRYARNAKTYPSKEADGKLSNLDRIVRRTGRVSSIDVSEIIGLLKHHGNATSEQALLLLRCMGSKMPELTGEARTQQLNTMWQFFKEQGVKMTTAHYNSLMAMYNQNGHLFKPDTLLAELEESGLKANRVTYLRLVERFAEEGDIQGAMNILELMKKEDMPIGEPVFNALITAHFKAGDIDGAENTFKMMSESGVEPGADTFSALLLGNASNNNIDAIKETFAAAEQSEVTLYGRVYMDVIIRLTEVGHPEHVQTIIDLVNKSVGYNHDVISAILQLVAKGYYDVAFEVYKTMGEDTLNTRDLAVGAFFLKALCRNNAPVERMIEFLPEMYRNKTMEQGLLDGLFWYLNAKNIEKAREMMDIIEKKGIEIREHYLWPIYKTLEKGNDAKGIYDLFTWSMKHVEHKEMIITLQEYVIPALTNIGETIREIQDKLPVQIGSGIVKGVMVIDAIKMNDFKKAVEIGADTSSPTALLSAALRPYFVQAYKTNPDLDSVLELLNISKNWPNPKQNGHIFLCGDFLKTIVYMSDTDTIHKVVRWYADHNLKVFRGDLGNVKSSDKVTDDILEVLPSIDAGALDEYAYQFPQGTQNRKNILYHQKTASELEILRDDPEANQISVRKYLFIHYTKEGKVKEAMGLVKEFEETGFVMNGEMHRQMAFMAANFMNDPQLARKHNDMLYSDFPDYNVFTSMTISLAKCFVKNDLVQDALDALQQYTNTHGAYLHDSAFGEGHKLERPCVDLINACKDAKIGAEMLEALFKGGFIKKGSYNLLEAYIKSAIERADAEGLVTATEYCVRNFNKLPLYPDVFNFLIKQNKSDELQKVMDMCIKLFGEMAVLNQLTICFVECGLMNQARKVMETPGLRAITDLHLSACDRYIDNREVTHLRNLVDITKDFYGVDRDNMLFMLIKGYGVAKQPEKALDVYTMYDEENILPRPRTLRYLASVLKSADMDVPFEVPNVKSSHGDQQLPTGFTPGVEATGQRQQTGPVPVEKPTPARREPVPRKPVVLSMDENMLNDLDRDLLAAYNTLGMNKVIEILEANVGKEYNVLADIAKAAFLQRYKAELGRLCEYLVELRDMELLCKISQTLPGNNAKVFESIILAAINKGDSSVAVLSKSIDENPKVSMAFLFKLEGTDTFSKVCDMLKEFADHGSESAVSALCKYHMYKKEYNVAEELLNKYPKCAESVQPMQVIENVKTSVEDLQRVKAIIKFSKDKAATESVFVCLVKAQITKNQLSEAVDTVKEALECDVTEGSFSKEIRNKLGDFLTSNNQTVPWTVEPAASSQEAHAS